MNDTYDNILTEQITNAIKDSIAALNTRKDIDVSKPLVFVFNDIEISIKKV